MNIFSKPYNNSLTKCSIQVTYSPMEVENWLAAESTKAKQTEDGDYSLSYNSIDDRLNDK